MTDLVYEKDEQDLRIETVLGADDVEVSEDSVYKYSIFLEENIQFPCDVTGIEDFKWEEYFLFGPGDAKEYARLRKDQPSHKDIYQLVSIDHCDYSKWMMFYGEDISAAVIRKSDGKRFKLGLSEIKPTQENSKERILLDDYAAWFVNNR